jgi:hypothetical protein
MCSQVEVLLIYLLCARHALNCIEELFAELKAFIKRRWQAYANNSDQGYNTFLEW